MATTTITDISWPPFYAPMEKAMALGSITNICNIGVGIGQELFYYSYKANAVSPVTGVGIDDWVFDADGRIKNMSLTDQNLVTLTKELVIATVNGIALSEPTAPTLSIIEGDMVSSASNYADGYFDFIYIDHRSRSEAVWDSLFAAWIPKVASGKFIAGHQYNDNEAASGRATGVKAAVDSAVANQGTTLYHWTLGNFWMFTKA